MKLIFFGTSEFAIPALKLLLDSQHQVLAVVTKCDQPSGRGLREKPTPVKTFVLNHAPSTVLIQPAKLRNREFLDDVARLGAEIFVVASFPIMPMSLVEIPPMGCLNIHPSLLPEYRGAAPIRWTLINGETRTGVTTFFIGGKVDAGNILLQRETEIAPDENYGRLHDRLSEMGAELAIESLKAIAKGEIHTRQQDNSLATPAPKITPEQLRIDWTRDAASIHNQVRAFSPGPGAYTILNGKLLKVLTSEPDYSRRIPPGSGICERNGLFAGCGDGALELLEVQMEGRKCLPAKAFICGFRDKEFSFG